MKNEKIILRALEPTDIDLLFDVENNQALWHLSQTLRPFSRFEIEQYLLSLEKDPFKAGQVRLMIEESLSNSVVGIIDLFDIDAVNQRAGVGIVILQEYRQKGYASRALQLLKEYAFNVLNLHQLYCNIEPDNTASLKLFQEQGFKIICSKKDWNRKNGEWIDEYFLQCLAP